MARLKLARPILGRIRRFAPRDITSRIIIQGFHPGILPPSVTLPAFQAARPFRFIEKIYYLEEIFKNRQKYL